MIIGILPNVNSFTESGCKFEDQCSFAQSQVEGQPSKKPKKDGDKRAVVLLEDAPPFGLRISGHRAAGIFTEFTEEHKSLGTNLTSASLKSYTASRKHPKKNKGPSLGVTQVKNHHQRSPYAPTFEDRSQRLRDKNHVAAETRRLARSISKLSEKDKATFFSPTNVWRLLAPSVIKPEEREFVVASGASMHMLSRKDLNCAELETVRVSESPTTVVTANGEVQTKETTPHRAYGQQDIPKLC